MTQYYIETYGCTSNQGESLQIERQLRDAGHYPVDSPVDADVAILNTCTVIEKTESNMLRRASELSDRTSEVIITGCMALAQGDAFKDAGIDAAVYHWDEVPNALANGECPTTTPDTKPVLDGKIGILPIARGCMSNCSYCITKFATGRVDSPPIAENVKHARALLDAGAVELRITGQDTGVYGWDTGERSLPALLKEICELPGDFRVRLGMANPGGVHGIREELVKVFDTYDELYNFIHLPVQSGSDPVLESMRRQHRVQQFIDIVDTFDAHLDDWTLATDFIVGFPSETEDDFSKSMNLLGEIRPEKTNITRFSKRPGTDAADMKGLGGPIKKERSKQMSTRALEIVGDVYKSMVGERRSVLAIEQGTGVSIKCRDDAYRQIIVKEAQQYDIEIGDRFDVKITSAEHVYCFGTPLAVPVTN